MKFHFHLLQILPISETKSSDDEVDDIPPELQAVFEEDENGISPTKILREEQQEDFQALVDNESKNQ